MAPNPPLRLPAVGDDLSSYIGLPVEEARDTADETTPAGSVAKAGAVTWAATVRGPGAIPQGPHRW